MFDTLLTKLDISPITMNEALGLLHKSKLSFGDLYLQNSSLETLVLSDDKVSKVSYNVDTGLGVRTVVDGNATLAYGNILTKDAILQTTKQAISMQHHYTSNKVLANNAGKLNLYTSINETEDLSLKAKLLMSINKAAKSVANVVKVEASLSFAYEEIVIANTLNVKTFDIRPLVRLNITVTVCKNNRFETAYDGFGGRYSTAVLMEKFNIEAIAKQTANKANEKLNAVSAPAGAMPVVLGNGWPGIMLHEAVGHGLEGDAIYKKTSTFANLLGTKVASNGVNIYDDGTIAKARGSLNVDDEGNLSEKTPLILDGTLVGFMHDTISAKALNSKVTGNARRESYAHLPMPRMTNTYMDNGAFNPKDIIKSVKKGIYAENFGGGQVDTTSGNFVFSISDGYLIENGAVTNPIKGATLIGNGSEALKQISMIGNDFCLDDGVGTCGKNAQSVPVGVGQPTTLVDKITVGGSNA